jgi:hypothetical protein
MRLLRTADGGFINAVKIVRLADERGAPAGGGWVARLDDGEEVALASYYSAPGRVERDLPHLLVLASATAQKVIADCASDTCCCT